MFVSTATTADQDSSCSVAHTAKLHMCGCSRPNLEQNAVTYAVTCKWTFAHARGMSNKGSPTACVRGGPQAVLTARYPRAIDSHRSFARNAAHMRRVACGQSNTIQCNAEKLSIWAQHAMPVLTRGMSPTSSKDESTPDMRQSLM